MATTLRLVINGMTTQGDRTTLNLGPNYNDDNDDWGVDTPSASLNLVVNAETAAQFEYGQLVEVLLTPGEVPDLGTE